MARFRLGKVAALWASALIAALLGLQWLGLRVTLLDVAGLVLFVLLIDAIVSRRWVRYGAGDRAAGGSSKGRRFPT